MVLAADGHPLQLTSLSSANSWAAHRQQWGLPPWRAPRGGRRGITGSKAQGITDRRACATQQGACASPPPP